MLEFVAHEVGIVTDTWLEAVITTGSMGTTEYSDYCIQEHVEYEAELTRLRAGSTATLTEPEPEPARASLPATHSDRKRINWFDRYSQCKDRVPAEAAPLLVL